DLGDLLGPLARRAPEESPAAVGAEAAAHVEQTSHRARVAARVLGGRVDRRVAPREGLEALEVRQGREPAVGLRADEAQHARLERADPDLDVVRGRGTALGAVDVVVRTARDETLARRRVPQT